MEVLGNFRFYTYFEEIQTKDHDRLAMEYERKARVKDNCKVFNWSIEAGINWNGGRLEDGKMRRKKPVIFEGGKFEIFTK